MPMANGPDTDWIGYLVEGGAKQTDAFLETLRNVLEQQNLPKVTMEIKQLSMWWRKSKCLDLKSSIDGEIVCTVHAMDYSQALFVGVAFAPVRGLGNYYKRMAAVAFIETVDRTAQAVLEQVTSQPSKRIQGLGASGRVAD